MIRKTRRVALPLILVGFLPVTFSACFNVPTLEEAAKPSNPWSQGIPSDSAPPLDTGDTGSGEGAYCQIAMPSSISQNQELRVTVTSQSIAKFQVSTNSAEYVDLGTSNGTITWPANTFPAGIYSLRFRGMTGAKQFIACDPSSQTLTVIAVAGNPPPPGGGGGGGTPPPELNGSTYPNYVPVVAINGATSSFRTLQNPNRLVTTTIDGVPLKILDFEAISNLQGMQGQLKFFLPPGTMAFDANIYLYLAYQEGRGAMRLYAPPTIAIPTITPAMVNAPNNIPGGSDYSKVFSKLSGRGEMLYYSAGAPANFWLLSSPTGYSSDLATGGYVYGNFQYPGGQFQRSLWKVYVRASCYERWYASANTKWDANGNPQEGVSHTCN